MALDHNELSRLREFMLMLIKRRGQAKRPIQDMV